MTTITIYDHTGEELDAYHGVDLKGAANAFWSAMLAADPNSPPWPLPVPLTPESLNQWMMDSLDGAYCHVSA